MTTTLDRPVKKTAKVGVPGLPQVNLLPPEIRAARSLAVVKRWLALGLAFVVIAVGVVYAGSLVVRGDAEAELADATAETARLQTEAAKYAEVPQVLGSIQAVEAGRVSGMSTEILWKPYLDAVTAVLPAQVSIESFTVTGPTPMDASMLPADPLQAPSVGSIAFSGRSKTVPDTSAWLDALATVPGFASPWVSSVAVTEEDGNVFYTVSSTVQLTDAAFALRFLPIEGTN